MYYAFETDKHAYFDYNIRMFVPNYIEALHLILSLRQKILSAGRKKSPTKQIYLRYSQRNQTGCFLKTEPKICVKVELHR